MEPIYTAAGDGIARTTNTVEGWHNGLQSLFMCSHPSLWTFLDGLKQDCNKQTAAFLQGATGVEQPSTKRYRNLVTRVAVAVGSFDRTDVLTYLRAIAHMSHT